MENSEIILRIENAQSAERPIEAIAHLESLKKDLSEEILKTANNKEIDSICQNIVESIWHWMYCCSQDKLLPNEGKFTQEHMFNIVADKLKFIS